MRKILYAGMLIMICNISYADIASTGYVDSVIATKQDTITDIATIRSGAAAGATAVQPETLDNYAKLDDANTFTQGQVISRSSEGAILKLTSGTSNTNFLLERTGGSTCVLESGGSVGLFGTMTNHPLQIRTNYQARATVGTDGSFVLATDVASNSNDNQVATTKWVNSKLSPVAKSGSYNDLTNKPTLSTVATSGAYADLSGKPTLATVATSGSYNDLSNKPTIPSLPTGPSDGIYKMVWNGKFKTFMFQKESDLLSCSSGTYDIGFSQCIDPATKGTTYGYRNDSTGDQGAGSSNTATYGLTTDQTWGVTFDGYGNVKGIASCNSTNGTENQSTTTEFSQTDKGQHCWCKMTEPAASRWVFRRSNFNADYCAYGCAYNCAFYAYGDPGFRSGVFGSVGN